MFKINPPNGPEYAGIDFPMSLKIVSQEREGSTERRMRLPLGLVLGNLPI